MGREMRGVLSKNTFRTILTSEIRETLPTDPIVSIPSHEEDTIKTTSHGWQLAFVAAFVIVNLVMPVVVADLYPFTSAPMFRDQPRRYCNHYAFAPDGKEIPAERLSLQRIYDGNPTGLGVGIQPPPVLERTFGDVPDRETVETHVRTQLAKHPDLDYVEIVQEIVESDGEGGLAARENRWRVDREVDPQ